MELRRDFYRKKMMAAKARCRKRMGMPKSGELDAVLGKGGGLSEIPLRHLKLVFKRHPDGVWLQASPHVLQRWIHTLTVGRTPTS